MANAIQIPVNTTIARQRIWNRDQLDSINQLIQHVLNLQDERKGLRHRITTLEVEVKIARGQRDAADRLNIVRATVEKGS